MFTLQPFIEAAGSRNIPLHTIMVVKDDELLGAHRFSEKRTYNVYSVTKSFLSVGIGMAIDEGLLSLSDRPVDAFGELLPDAVDAKWEQITLKHLLTMSTGHTKAFLMGKERKVLRGETPGETIPRAMKNEWILYVFDKPLEVMPGTEFHYGNQGPYLAGRMLEKAAGVTVRDFLYEKMWRYMKTPLPVWETDPLGHTFTASGLYLDVEDMAKFGHMCLNKGSWDGRQLVSKAWMDLATAKQMECDPISIDYEAKDELAGYGYYFWRNSVEGFRAYGRESQFVIVLPDKKTVACIQADFSDCQKVLDIFWEHIYQQL